MENSMEVPQKIKNGTALWPSDSTSGGWSEETQNTNSKKYMHPFVHSSVVYNSQAMEATNLSVHQQKVDKKYIMEYYSSRIKNEILPFVTTWMDLEGIMLSESSQSEKDNYHMISLTCRILRTI